MMIKSLDYTFLEIIPEELEEGMLYISPRFRVIIHLCCCGCKNKVVTPLSPARWKMFFDGKTISLSPSIGNWSFDCESHYWIKNSEVVWADSWSKNKISAGKEYEREKRSKYYKEVNKETKPTEKSAEPTKIKKKVSLFDWIKSFFKS